MCAAARAGRERRSVRDEDCQLRGAPLIGLLGPTSCGLFPMQLHSLSPIGARIEAKVCAVAGSDGY